MSSHPTSIENRYYCYRHVRPDTNQPFYVGIGTKTNQNHESFEGEYRRAFVSDSRHRSKWWIDVFNKCNGKITVEVLYECNSENEIKHKEVEFIALYGRRDQNKGTLVNMTDGGDGVSGFKLSEEAKQKISKGNKKRVWTSEAKLKASLLRKGKPGKKPTKETLRKMSEAQKGKPRSKEYRDKIAASLIGRFSGGKNPWARAVLQFSVKGEFIKEWSSIAEAGGFVWKYKQER